MTPAAASASSASTVRGVGTPLRPISVPSMSNAASNGKPARGAIALLWGALVMTCTVEGRCDSKAWPGATEVAGLINSPAGPRSDVCVYPDGGGTWGPSRIVLTSVGTLFSKVSQSASWSTLWYSCVMSVRSLRICLHGTSGYRAVVSSESLVAASPMMCRARSAVGMFFQLLRKACLPAFGCDFACDLGCGEDVADALGVAAAHSVIASSSIES